MVEFLMEPLLDAFIGLTRDRSELGNLLIERTAADVLLYMGRDAVRDIGKSHRIFNRDDGGYDGLWHSTWFDCWGWANMFDLMRLEDLDVDHFPSSTG